MSDTKRARNFLLNLYPEEDITHKNALEKIITSYDYAYIVHDKDVDEETGEIKKSHVHCILCFRNAQTIKVLSETLGIKSNYIEKAQSLDNSLLYLIHHNNPEKYQYSIDEVKGSLKKKLTVLINSENILDENEAIEWISDYIDSCDYITNRSFVKWCTSNGIWKYYRRCPTIIHRLIDEHNNKVRSNKIKSLGVSSDEK